MTAGEPCRTSSSTLLQALVMGAPKGEERERNVIFEAIMVENFPSLIKNITYLKHQHAQYDAEIDTPIQHSKNVER